MLISLKQVVLKQKILNTDLTPSFEIGIVKSAIFFFFFISKKDYIE